MLPKNLNSLKKKLTDKGYANRTENEDKLLASLEVIEKEFKKIEVLSESKDIEKSLNESGIEKYAVTGGPLGSCPCCGK